MRGIGVAHADEQHREGDGNQVEMADGDCGEAQGQHQPQRQGEKGGEHQPERAVGEPQCGADQEHGCVTGDLHAIGEGFHLLMLQHHLAGHADFDAGQLARRGLGDFIPDGGEALCRRQQFLVIQDGPHDDEAFGHP